LSHQQSFSRAASFRTQAANESVGVSRCPLLVKKENKNKKKKKDKSSRSAHRLSHVCGSSRGTPAASTDTFFGFVKVNTAS